MKTIIFLFDGNFIVEGNNRHYIKGDIDIVSDQDAERLIIGLCAEEYKPVITETPVPKYRTKKEVSDER